MNDELQDQLIEATAEFGLAYEVAKEASDDADQAKARFYTLADQELATRRLPRKTIKLAYVEDAEAEAFVTTYHPEWRVVSCAPEEGKVLIEKDPSKMKYAFPNPEDGQLYQRTVQDKGKAQVDIKRLQEEDPGLWQEVSHWDPLVKELIEAAVIYAMPTKPDKEGLDKVVDEFFSNIRPGVRILKPSVAWSQSQGGRLQKYLIPAGITVKIVPPRAVTEEDLVAEDV